ncbi:hypothetical protein MKX01_018264, partial [Papaver californicum]
MIEYCSFWDQILHLVIRCGSQNRTKDHFWCLLFGLIVHCSCSYLLQTCINLEQLKQIHAQTLTQRLHHLQNISCKIFNTYTKFNKPIEAYHVFNQIQNPDLVSWTCLISLHLNTDRPFQALLVFSKLVFLGLKPDSFSVVGALTAC